MFTTDTTEEAEHLRTLFSSLAYSGELAGRHVVQNINRARTDTQALEEMDRLAERMETVYQQMKLRDGDKKHKCAELPHGWEVVLKDGQWRLFRGAHSENANFCPFCGVDLKTL